MERRFSSNRAAPLLGSTSIAAVIISLSACGGSFTPEVPDPSDASDTSDATALTFVPLPDGASGSSVASDAGVGDANGGGGSPSADASGAAVDASASDAPILTDALVSVAMNESGTSDAADDATTCDPSKDPKDEPCLIDDAYGIFVATTGTPDAAAGAGTLENPVATVGAGLALARSEGKTRVYICGGNYVEAVNINSPISLYGGFSCTDGSVPRAWEWTGAATNVRAPSVTDPLEPIYAISVTGTNSALVSIEDMAFAAPDASGQDPLGNGASSIAAFVSASTVGFYRCSLIAGNGARGSDGTTASTNYPNAASKPSAAGGTNTCVYKADGVTPDSSTGGTAGNDNSVPAVLAGDGTSVPNVLNVSSPNDGLGVGAPGVADSTYGDNGANGAARTPGSAASRAGQLSTSGWIPTPGGAGPAGMPGQGGGGGDWACGYPGGLSGAAGGCGGSGGTGGGGGGASIALAVLASNVILRNDSLVSSRGGAGGTGGSGQIGEGSGPTLTSTCPQGDTVRNYGTSGGSGAGGSGGGGGSAGISVGILYSGTTLPTFSPADTAIAPGVAGVPGVGGAGGPAAPSGGNTGAAGDTGYLDPHASAAYLLIP